MVFLLLQQLVRKRTEIQSFRRPLFILSFLFYFDQQ